jgi:hypothetical protein
MADPTFQESVFSQSYNSYAGTDIRAMISMPAADGLDPVLRTLGNLQTISYSIFREKYPVRALGHVGEKGRTRGTRTIAGSMVFTVFDRHVLYDMLRKNPGDMNTNGVMASNYGDLSYVMVDQLPQFDIIIHFANEYGHVSELVIFGVEISAEGQVMSVEDLITENTVQYTATHLALMRPGGYVSAVNRPANFVDNFGSIMNKDASSSLQNLIKKTRNPFR